MNSHSLPATEEDCQAKSLIAAGRPERRPAQGLAAFFKKGTDAGSFSNNSFHTGGIFQGDETSLLFE